jgi:hypothetical protein
MAEGIEGTASDVIAKKAVSIGLNIHVDEAAMKQHLDPVLASITKKLNQLSKESELKSGIFGDNFFTQKVKAFTGLDLTLVKATQNMIAYGRASKEMDTDGGKFYDSLNFMQKGLVDLSSAWDRRKESQKKALEQSEKQLESTTEMTDVLAKAEQASLLTSESLDLSLGSLGEGALGAGDSLTVMGMEGAEAAAAATGGLSILLAILIAVAEAAGKVFYQVFTAALTARNEAQKFDRLFSGVGHEGILRITGSLKNLNTELWGLGQSIENVNKVVFAATDQGLSFSRALDTTLVKSIMTLDGVAGATAASVGTLYTTLLKGTLVSVESLKNMSNALVKFNQFAFDSKNLGKISFDNFKESIESSSDALNIASAAGDKFVNKMSKDLTALAGFANTLSISISGLNKSFDEAGNMLMSDNSPFRTMLALSGGANINQMLTNQFDKTDAMLKGVKYLQDFNKSFGGNIALTAQVAEKQLGISRDMAIKMINMRQDAIDDMRRAQFELENMRNDEAEKAYEKVNSTIGGMWDRIKMMFSNFFFNAFGGADGMQKLVGKLEDMMAKLKGFMENSVVIEKLRVVIGNVADWLGDNLSKLVDWVSEKIDQFSQGGSQNPIVSMWNDMIDTLANASIGIGMQLGFGFLRAVAAVGSLGLSEGIWWLLKKIFGGGEASKTVDNSVLNNLQASTKPHEERIRDIDKQRGELSKWNPEAVTYGKNASGGVGFMTVGQKEYALEQEKKKEQAELKKIQQDIANYTKETAINTRNKDNPNANPTDPRVVPTDNPITHFALAPSVDEAVAFQG